LVGGPLQSPNPVRCGRSSRSSGSGEGDPDPDRERVRCPGSRQSDGDAFAIFRGSSLVPQAAFEIVL